MRYRNIAILCDTCFLEAEVELSLRVFFRLPVCQFNPRIAHAEVWRFMMFLATEDLVPLRPSHPQANLAPETRKLSLSLWMTKDV